MMEPSPKMAVVSIGGEPWVIPWGSLFLETLTRQKKIQQEKSVENQDENGGNRSNFVRYMSNPRSFTLKKWFVELLGKDFTPHNNIIERISSAIVTEQDMKEFGGLITTVYEKAYRKAVDDYREQVEKLGLKINVVPQNRTS